MNAPAAHTGGRTWGRRIRTACTALTLATALAIHTAPAAAQNTAIEAAMASYSGSLLWAGYGTTFSEYSITLGVRFGWLGLGVTAIHTATPPEHTYGDIYRGPYADITFKSGAAGLDYYYYYKLGTRWLLFADAGYYWDYHYNLRRSGTTGRYYLLEERFSNGRPEGGAGAFWYIIPDAVALGADLHTERGLGLRIGLTGELLERIIPWDVQ